MSAVSLLAAIGAMLVVLLAARVRPLATRRIVRFSLPGARRRWPRRPPPLDDVAAAEWCERVAGDVRAGRSLAAAVIDDPGPTPFPDVDRALRRGRDLAAALSDEPADPASPAGLIAPVVTACAAVGGPAARPLEQVAAVLHGRAAERAERATSSAQARLSARVLTVVPFGVLGLLAATEPTVRGAIATPAGTFCLVAGALFNTAGWWWMRTIIARAA